MKKLFCIALAAVLMMALCVSGVAAPSVNDTLLSHLGGDVNGDWTVTTSDVRALFAAVSGESDKLLSEAADANGDGRVNALDAVVSLAVSVGQKTPTFFRPTLSMTEGTAEDMPQGEDVAFVISDPTNTLRDSENINRLIVAQSREELLAWWNYGRSVKNGDNFRDFTVDYDESFFEDRALILYDSQLLKDGLFALELEKMVKSGNELCMVRKVTLEYQAPLNQFNRFIMEVSKEDLADIESVSVYTYYERIPTPWDP